MGFLNHQQYSLEQKGNKCGLEMFGIHQEGESQDWHFRGWDPLDSHDIYSWWFQPISIKNN